MQTASEAPVAVADARRHLAAYSLLSESDRGLLGLALWHLAQALRRARDAKAETGGLDAAVASALAPLAEAPADAARTPPALSPQALRRTVRSLERSLDGADQAAGSASPQERFFFRYGKILNFAYAAVLALVFIGISIDRGSFAPWLWRRLVFSGFYVGDVRQDWGKLRRDEGQNGRALVVGGQAQKGLGTHAYSRIELVLTTSAQNFSGRCGYPDEANGAVIKCSVSVDGKTVYTSPELSSTKRLGDPFTLPLKPDAQVVLIVNAVGASNNAAHAAWLDLKAW